MMMTDEEQFQALNTLAFLSDLFTVGKKEIFTRTEILKIINIVINDPELFDPLVVIAHDIAVTPSVD